jgi:tRNA1Val (adenine37-N6)-methyltransferase
MKQDTLDDLLINNLKVFQAREGYRFSIDAVLLAHFPEVGQVRKIIDIGTGSGVIPLLLSQRTKALITGIEIQADMVTRARQSICFNHLEEQINVIRADINNIDSFLPPGCADLVVSNPPYWKKGEGRISNNPEQAMARHELALTLEQVVDRAAYLLLPKGKLALIERAQRLPEALHLLSKYHLTGHRLRTVHSNRSSDARMVLLEAVKGSRAGLKIMPPLYIYNEDGSYSREIEEIYQGGTVNGG